MFWPFRRKRRDPLLVPERDPTASNPRFASLRWTLVVLHTSEGWTRGRTRYFYNRYTVLEEPRLMCVETGGPSMLTRETWLVDGQSCASLDVALDRLGVPPVPKT